MHVVEIASILGRNKNICRDVCTREDVIQKGNPYPRTHETMSKRESLTSNFALELILRQETAVGSTDNGLSTVYEMIQALSRVRVVLSCRKIGLVVGLTIPLMLRLWWLGIRDSGKPVG